VRSYRLTNPDDSALPVFVAGAHIDVHMKNGSIRQYSLCNAATDRSCYRISVLGKLPATENSEHFFNQVKIGDLLTISQPRNLFKLFTNADRHLLIASGIGIAPILSMVYMLEQQKADYWVHYCAPSPDQAAFRDELEGLVQRGQLAIHFDSDERVFDLQSTLRSVSTGTHLYYCGPPDFMAAAQDASAHWPAGTVHCEYFQAPVSQQSARESDGEDREFKIRLVRSEATYMVPSHKSIVDVLRENGVMVDTSCEDGFCGSCLTRYLAGEPDHRDEVLDDEDREEYVLICCARSKTSELELDL